MLIYEIHDFSQIPQYLKFFENSLFITDLDETIFQTKQAFPASPWFDHHYQTGKDIKKTLEIYHPAMKQSEVMLAHPEVVITLKKMREDNIEMMALTSRGPELNQATHKQLASIGIDFDFPVIFANGRDKGQCLEAFLSGKKSNPSAIIFCDDKLSHVQSMARVCEKLGIEFIGLHCCYLQHKFENYDPRVAKIQEEFFCHTTILSDEEAQVIHEHREAKFRTEAVLKHSPLLSAFSKYKRSDELENSNTGEISAQVHAKSSRSSAAYLRAGWV